MIFSPPLDGRWLALLAVALLGLPLWLTGRNRLLQPPRLRWTVLALRLAVAGLLLLILANPVERRSSASARKPVTGVVLVDTSRSMDLGDPSRLARGRELLGEALGPAMEGVRVLSFAAGLGPEVTRLSELRGDPASRRTCLGMALARGVALAQGSGVRNLVVVSDGRTDDPALLADATTAAATRGTRVSVVPLGDPPTRPNLALVNCQAERQAPPGSRVPVTAVVRVSGGTGQNVELVLEDDAGKVLARDRFPAVDGTYARPLQAQLGDRDTTLRLKLLPLENELSGADNDLAFTVRVTRLPLRVLYMEGSNHKNKRWTDVWEYEFISKALAEDGMIEVDILTVDEQKAEGGRLFNVRRPEEAFPRSREALLGYDVVICSDITRTIFSDEQLAWTVELVAQQGGGFCMIGGYTAFGAGRWDQTVWEQMIPMDMKTEDEGYTWDTVTPTIPEDARLHPIWHLDEDPDRCARILAAHPPFMGFNLVNRAKPAAKVLAVHEAKGMPLIAVQSYGRGRSLAFASDAAGGWGERYQTEWGEGDRDNRYYRRFWLNVVRWLAENSLAAHRTRLLAGCDAVNYLPGETIHLQARKLGITRGEDLRQWRVRAELAGVPGASTALALDEQQARFVGQLVLPEDAAAVETVVRFSAAGPGNAAAEVSEVPVRVLGTDREMADPTPDRQTLEHLAARTGGRVITAPQELAELVRLPPESSQAGGRLFTVPLWDRAWLWFLILALMSAEWFLRKAALFRSL